MLKLIVRPKQRFGYCFLRFTFAESAAQAIAQFNQSVFRGSVLQVNYADKSVEQPGEDPWGKQVDEWARSVENDMSKMAPRLQLKEPLPECEVDGLSSDSRALEQRDTDELSASTAVLSLLERPQAAHHQEEGFNAKLLQMTLSELSPSLGRGKLPTLSDKSDGCGEANTEDDELDDGE